MEIVAVTCFYANRVLSAAKCMLFHWDPDRYFDWVVDDGEESEEDREAKDQRQQPAAHPFQASNSETVTWMSVVILIVYKMISMIIRCCDCVSHNLAYPATSIAQWKTIMKDLSIWYDT